MSEVIILIGIQASGKTTYAQSMLSSYFYISLDNLKTRNQEIYAMERALINKWAFVVDNTNPTIKEREVYIKAAKEHGYKVVGLYFQSRIFECASRNKERLDKPPIPNKGLAGTYNKLQIPTHEEGFDELLYVSIVPTGGFAVNDWVKDNDCNIL